MPVPRLWRCGNRGNVASVLIEKPARGDFLPILDGGYSLQYGLLLEYREGQGMMMFCQLDLTDLAVDFVVSHLRFEIMFEAVLAQQLYKQLLRQIRVSGSSALLHQQAGAARRADQRMM